MELQIKICGVTTPADARAAAAAGADAIGLNFHAPSPRYVDRATAAAIIEALPPGVEIVAVFADESPDRAIELVSRLGRIRLLQWHGANRPREVPPPFGLIPAFAVGTCDDVATIADYLNACRTGRRPAAVLVDGHDPARVGGTGRTVPWELVGGLRLDVPLLLAGGLTPDNVADAVRTVRPQGVDVASGVESRPGRKDPEKMHRFVANARAAAGDLTPLTV